MSSSQSGPSAWTPPIPPNYHKEPMQGPETIHNHYHSAPPKQSPWYRRKRCICFLVCALFKDNASAEFETGAGSTSTSFASPSIIVSASVSTLRVTMSPEPTTSASSSIVSVTNSVLSTNSDQISSTLSPSSSSTHSDQISSTLSQSSSWTSSWPISPSPSTLSESAWTSSTSTSSVAAETSSAVFKLSGKSQLASGYANRQGVELYRRIVVWQDSESNLIATEWSSTGGATSTYRIADKLASSMADAKHGTPLAMAIGDSGVHVFFVDTQDWIVHLSESAPGNWTFTRVLQGPKNIVAAKYSTLSAGFHRGPDDVEILCIAFESPQQKLQLAMTDEPDESSRWHIVDVTPLPRSVPGQADTSCFSLAVNWPSGQDDKNALMMAVLGRDGLAAWRCLTDQWPPQTGARPCEEMKKAFQDNKGQKFKSSPPPQQLAWIRHDGKVYKRAVDGSSELSLVSLDGSGHITDDRIKPDLARDSGPRLKTSDPFLAISTTDEGLLFATSTDKISVYRLDEDEQKWQLVESLMGK
ncbi:hypothetical protein CDD82_3473 [Ophiocordyceps australis]|uniref:Fucose-specific lectin n=1 Tax=Ophiocordyceps australis TaxID=1399860 RepID=A0A2C5YHH1_9HYPO|nr:hypothetical protein CDD82_3473 [Ophiocordyceps australis]